jgi:hypothetical protein
MPRLSRYDTIICQYVLCVLENEADRQQVMDTVFELLNRGGCAYFTVRRDISPTSRTEGQRTWWVTTDLPVLHVEAGKYIIYEVGDDGPACSSCGGRQVYHLRNEEAVVNTEGLWHRTRERVVERVERALVFHDVKEWPSLLVEMDGARNCVAHCAKSTDGEYTIAWNLNKLLEIKYQLDFHVPRLILALEEVWSHEYAHLLTDVWGLGMVHDDAWKSVARQLGAVPSHKAEIQERAEFRRLWYETRGYEIPTAATVVGSISA